MPSSNVTLIYWRAIRQPGPPLSLILGPYNGLFNLPFHWRERIQVEHREIDGL